MTVVTYAEILKGLNHALLAAIRGSEEEELDAVEIIDAIDHAISATQQSRSRCSDSAPAREVAS